MKPKLVCESMTMNNTARDCGEKLTSRERIKKTINFQEPDRVPLDIGGSKISGIHVDEYIALGRHLGVDVELPKVYEQLQMIVRPDGLVRQALHGDVVELENDSERWGLVNKDWKEWKTQAGNRVLMPGNFHPITEKNGDIYVKSIDGKRLAYMRPGGLYFDPVYPASTGGSPPKVDPDKYKTSLHTYTDAELRSLEKRGSFLHSHTDYAIIGGFLKGTLGNNNIAYMSVDDWLITLVSDTDYAEEILQAITERALENLALYLEAAAPYIDIILVSCADYGTQNGPLFSPDLFNKLYAPNYKKMNDYIHRQTDIKTMYHSCGAIWDFLETFISMGVDVLNPIQLKAGNMNPSILKQELQGKIVIWGGGVDTQDVLPFGTKEEVRTQVKQRIRAFAPGGGFVFTPVHNIQYGVPVENVMEMIRTVLEAGVYPVTE